MAVVTIVILIAGAVRLYYSGRGALYTGRQTTMISNGRNIYVTLFAQAIDDPSDSPFTWPQTDGARHHSGTAHQTSTEYWQWLVTSGVMNVDFSFFSGPGLSARGS